MQYLEILCLSVIISIDIMLHFGITRINGPTIIFVDILFEMGGRLEYDTELYSNFKIY